MGTLGQFQHLYLAVTRTTITEEDITLPALTPQDKTSISITRMTDTKEDVALPTSTPQDEASRSCTKQTLCKKAKCPIYSEPIPGTHQDQDLSQELKTTPPPKDITKFSATALPNHLISILLTQLKQATLDNDLESIDTLLHLSAHYWENPIWYWYGV